MNLAKSIFISFYITLLALGVVRAVWKIFDSGAWLPWLWILVALLPGLGFFAWLYVAKVARTGRVSVLMWAFALIAAAVTLFSRTMTPEVAFWVIGVGIIGALAYILWYSRFPQRNSEILRVGATLPPVRLLDEKGAPLNTADLKAPLLLIFYRGNWCPLCMAQMREVADSYQELERRGIQVLAISPQPASHSADLAKRFKVNIRFCADQDNRVAKQLGIFAKNGLPMGLQVLGYESDTVLPTVVITDHDGKILFADLTDNYRVRPEPDQFLTILDQAGVP